jgi:hypothetical protein
VPLRSGLSRREIEHYAYEQDWTNSGWREDHMRSMSHCVESWRRNSPHPEKRAELEWHFVNIFENVLMVLLFPVLLAGFAVATAIILPPVVGWLVFSIVVYLGKAALLRTKLGMEIWRQDADRRTKIGQTLIIVFQLSLREDLEMYLDDCLELRDEGVISELEFWRSFSSGSLSKSLRRTRSSVMEVTTRST